MFQFPAMTPSDRRRFLPRHWLRKATTLAVTAILALVALAIDLPPINADQASRPNVIFIMADDMGYECVAANGGGPYRTPRLDALAAGGLRFTEAHSQPICTPSRVQVMTGLYNSRNYIKFGLLDPKATTFGHLFQRAGYKTAIVGKWQLGGGYQQPHKFGFDEYCLWQLNRRPNRYPNPGLEINGKQHDFKNGEYGPDVVSDYACEFIQRNKDQPFFLYYPVILPHWPFEPTPDSPQWNGKARRDDAQEKSRQGVDDKYFVDMVEYTDKMVGKLVDQLEELGLRERTLIIFTGDNGTMTGLTSTLDGRPYPGGKGLLTINGTHVPLIASWPSVIEAGECHDLIDFTDILPTLTAAAQVALPDDIPFDGRSFWPQLQGAPGEPREWIYCWYYRNGKVGERGGGEFARDKRYKYYHDGRFFDLRYDLWEKSPLKADSLTAEQQAERERLKQVVTRYHRDPLKQSKDSQ